MSDILKIFIKHCSYCEKDFGCTSSDNIQRICGVDCDVVYGSADCSINSTFTVVSHGICNEECFITSLQTTNPQMAQRYMEVATA